MTSSSTLALVGATGGAGTTRLTVEFGATLARAGRDVALFDAAFATPGLARHVPGRIDPDLTCLLTDADTALADALVEHPAAVPGRLSVCPARAPFERLARAKTTETAERFEAVLARAAREFDHVLVDAPPVAANQAVAAVSAADRIGVVFPASERGLDALPAMGDRLHDLDAPADAAIANRSPAENVDAAGAADVAVPESERRAVADLPACADPDSTFAPAVARAVEACLGVDLDLSFPADGLLGEYLDR